MKRSHILDRIAVAARAAFLVAACAAVLLAGCRTEPSAEGTFDKTFTVNGPVRIELTNGSGDSRVSTGTPGEVRVHGEIQAHGWSEKGSQERVHEIEANPPVSQEGNLIRIGGSGSHSNSGASD